MKNTIKFAVAFSCAVVLTACNVASGDSAEVAKMKSIVKNVLIDGESAQFSDLKYYKSTNFGCGFVNAKNKLGGYVGKKKFIVSLEQNAADIDPDRDTPEAPRAPSYVSAEATINFVLESQKWMSNVEEIRNRYQAFDALVSEKCTDNPPPKEDKTQAAKKEAAEPKTQFVPYGEKEGVIDQYSDQYPYYAANISKLLAPELRNILRKKGTTETTAEFNKRSNYLALEGKLIDLNAEYGLVLLDGYSIEDAVKGVRGEYNADKGMISISTSDDFCKDPAKATFSDIPTGKEYGLTCDFNKFTKIVFSSKQTDLMKYFKRQDVLRNYIFVKDSFKLSKEKFLELPTASYSKDRFHVGLMFVGRINKNLSITNFQDQTSDYSEDATPRLPFTVTRIVYFNSKNGEILTSRLIK